jgi:hypothetical protein
LACVQRVHSPGSHRWFPSKVGLPRFDPWRTSVLSSDVECPEEIAADLLTFFGPDAAPS